MLKATFKNGKVAYITLEELQKVNPQGEFIHGKGEPGLSRSVIRTCMLVDTLDEVFENLPVKYQDEIMWNPESREVFEECLRLFDLAGVKVE